MSDSVLLACCTGAVQAQAKRHVTSRALGRQSVNFAATKDCDSAETIAVDFSVHYVVRSPALCAPLVASQGLQSPAQATETSALPG